MEETEDGKNNSNQLLFTTMHGHATKTKRESECEKVRKHLTLTRQIFHIRDGGGIARGVA